MKMKIRKQTSFDFVSESQIFFRSLRAWISNIIAMAETKRKNFRVSVYLQIYLYEAPPISRPIKTASLCSSFYFSHLRKASQNIFRIDVNDFQCRGNTMISNGIRKLDSVRHYIEESMLIIPSGAATPIRVYDAFLVHQPICSLCCTDKNIVYSIEVIIFYSICINICTWKICPWKHVKICTICVYHIISAGINELGVTIIFCHFPSDTHFLFHFLFITIIIFSTFRSILSRAEERNETKDVKATNVIFGEHVLCLHRSMCVHSTIVNGPSKFSCVHVGHLRKKRNQL